MSLNFAFTLLFSSCSPSGSPGAGHLLLGERPRNSGFCRRQRVDRNKCCDKCSGKVGRTTFPPRIGPHDWYPTGWPEAGKRFRREFSASNWAAEIFVGFVNFNSGGSKFLNLSSNLWASLLTSRLLCVIADSLLSTFLSNKWIKGRNRCPGKPLFCVLEGFFAMTRLTRPHITRVYLKQCWFLHDVGFVEVGLLGIREPCLFDLQLNFEVQHFLSISACCRLNSITRSETNVGVEGPELEFDDPGRLETFCWLEEERISSGGRCILPAENVYYLARNVRRGIFKSEILYFPTISPALSVNSTVSGPHTL